MSINKQKPKIVNFVVILAVMADLFFPKIGKADSQIPKIVDLKKQPEQKIVDFSQEKHFPKAEDAKPRKVIYITVTAYSSTLDQCDSTPFITASGKFVRDGIIASNFLPFGTKVRFPEHFGNKIFAVEDRMHPRYSNRVDIWMPTREQAKKFGIKRLKMEIY